MTGGTQDFLQLTRAHALNHRHEDISTQYALAQVIYRHTAEYLHGLETIDVNIDKKYAIGETHTRIVVSNEELLNAVATVTDMFRNEVCVYLCVCVCVDTHMWVCG